MEILASPSAAQFVREPKLLALIDRDLERLGYVGESTNKRLAYLIGLSRKLESPLSGAIISRAGAGKSRLIELIAQLAPVEDTVSYTRITPQALYYAAKRSLKHKLVIASELEGLAGSDYAIRELISSKKIKLAAPLKDGETGKLKTVEYEVEGPISLLFSTTQPAIHFENATRCFILSLDETKEQTALIHAEQRRMRTIERLEREAQAAEIRKLHHEAQRLLTSPLVLNPFAPDLTFPTEPLEMRREHEKYLSLIEALALLHQHQRPRGKCVYRGEEVEFVEVGIEDIEEANNLMTEVLGTRTDELARPSRELLAMIRRMVEERAKAFNVDPREYRFNRREVRDFTGWSDNQIKAHIGQLEELEYLIVGRGEQGRTYRYELDVESAAGQRKRLPGLTDTAKLRAKVGKLGLVGHGSSSVPVAASVEEIIESWEVGQNGEKEHNA